MDEVRKTSSPAAGIGVFPPDQVAGLVQFTAVPVCAGLNVIVSARAAVGARQNHAASKTLSDPNLSPEHFLTAIQPPLE